MIQHGYISQIQFDDGAYEWVSYLVPEGACFTFRDENGIDYKVTGTGRQKDVVFGLEDYDPMTGDILSVQGTQESG